MSKRRQGTLLRSSRDDRENLQLAREIIANPAGYIPLVVTWAKRLLDREPSALDHKPKPTQGTAQSSLAFDTATETRGHQ